jgi:hypothetical protein
MVTRSSNSRTRPGLAVALLEKEVARDKRAKQKGPDAMDREARRAEDSAASVKRIAVLERDMAVKDAMDDTPRPASKPKRKRQQRSESITPQSGTEEAPTPRPGTETEVSQSEVERPKPNKRKKKVLSFRQAIEEVELTDTETRTTKPSKAEPPKPRPIAKRRVVSVSV